MRLNKFIAENTPLSRRAADSAIEQGKVTINGRRAVLGTSVEPTDKVLLDNSLVRYAPGKKQTVLVNKPIGYICSKDGQGSPTIYDLLPKQYNSLNIAGRLDKDSSGLVLLTNDGELLNQITHPSYNKVKTYLVSLSKPLSKQGQADIKQGVILNDGLSRLQLQKSNSTSYDWVVQMHEGRNRQIRRTFEVIGNKVIKLHRTNIGDYSITSLQNKRYIQIDT